MTIGHEAEVTNAMETIGQGVQKEAANELIWRELHNPGSAVVAIVFPGKCDMIVVERNKPAVGDGDTVRVPSEIGENLGGAAKWLFCIDDPVGAAHLCQMSVECFGISQVVEIAKEAQSASFEGFLEPFEEETAEQLRQRFDGEEEVGPSCDPACPVGRQTAARHNTVDVRVMCQRLPPGMEYGKDANLRAESARVFGQRCHGLRRRREQDRVDGRLVLECNGGNRRGHGEDDVEIGNRQEFSLPVRQPLGPRRALTFWTMPVTAGIVGDTRPTTIVACFDVSTERGGTARHDRAHDALFDATQMPRMRPAIYFAMAAQNIGDLKPHVRSIPVHRVSTRRRHFQCQTIERALRRPDRMGRDLRVARRRRQIVVAEQNLNDPDVGSVLKKMRRETVTQRVQCDALRQSRRLHR